MVRLALSLALVLLIAPRAHAADRPPLTADALLGDAAACRPGAGRRPNALVRERSPYLREHAFDPVDWRPWGKSAFDEAKRRDVPVFVSSGYSTCHWCHVMHRDSFEDATTAEKLNDAFVCVKIDREELPDVDDALIQAVSAFQGSAGWPCTVLLHPDGRPFFGATFLPRKSLLNLIAEVTGLWKDPKKRAGLDADAQEIARRIATPPPDDAGHPAPDASLLDAASVAFSLRFDPIHKGFGPAPKFPRAPEVSLLLRLGRRDETARRMALETLDRILDGGIRDQLGGGFHRYATDSRWRVPHFEKTLYDNALLASVLTDAWVLTREPRYREGARSTLDYVLRDLALPSGGFASAEDADSSGEEGLFYTWTREELVAALPEKLARYAIARFGVEPAGAGPVGGRSVLFLAASPAEAAKSAGLAEPDVAAVESEVRAKLLAIRETRVRPPRDDKVLAGWNGLAIAALARAGDVFEEPRYGDAARRAFDLVQARLRTTDGGVVRRLEGGEARFPGSLEDYAYLARAAVELYEARLEPRDLDAARELLSQAIARAWDDERHAFRSRIKDADKLLPFTGGESIYEGATPAAPAVLAEELIRVGTLTGRDDPLDRARRELSSVASALHDEPASVPSYLSALARSLALPVEVVLAGPRGPALDALRAEVRKRDLPFALVALVDPLDPASARALGDLASGRGPAADGRPQAFVCVGSTCQLPVTSPEALGKLLDTLPTKPTAR